MAAIADDDQQRRPNEGKTALSGCRDNCQALDSRTASADRVVLSQLIQRSDEAADRSRCKAAWPHGHTAVSLVGDGGILGAIIHHWQAVPEEGPCEAVLQQRLVTTVRIEEARHIMIVNEIGQAVPLCGVAGNVLACKLRCEVGERA